MPENAGNTVERQPQHTLNSASAARIVAILGSTTLATSWYLHMAAAQLHRPAGGTASTSREQLGSGATQQPDSKPKQHLRKEWPVK